MLKCLRRYKTSEDGATIIEYAIVAPVLFFLVFGIIEFSIIMFVNSALQTATTIGARFGITGTEFAEFAGDFNDDDGDGLPDNATREGFIRAEIEQRTFGLLDPAIIEINSEIFASLSEVDRLADPSNLNAGDGGQVVLYTVSYAWPILSPLAGLAGILVGDGTGTFADGEDTITLSSSVVVVNESF